MLKTISIYTTATREHAIGILRLQAPLEANGLQIHWHRPFEAFSNDQVAQSDLIVIQRDFPRYVPSYVQVLEQAVLHHKPVIYELDDLLWELPPDHPDRNAHFYTDALWPMLFAALEADAVTVATPQLQEALQSVNPHTWLLRNYFNDRLWDLRLPKLRDASPLYIGYMGGASHLTDVRLILPVLQAILDEHKGAVRLKFWGLQPPEEIASHPWVEWQPLNTENYIQFADYFLQQSFDIFIAPLQPTLFNQCKSAIKYFECTALGAPGVCSRLGPYEQVIEHGKTGFLAGTLGDWKIHLNTLIENPSLRLQLAIQAQESIRQNWMLSSHAHEWLEAYHRIIADYAPRKDLLQRARYLTAVHTQWQERLAKRENQSKVLEEALETSTQLGEARQAELTEIKHSRAWKVVQLWWKWRSRWSSGPGRTGK